MAWLTRTSSSSSVDHITPDALASFGRFQFLGPALSGVPDSSAALALVEPLRMELYGDPAPRAAAIAELARHGAAGVWEAVGAWQFGSEFVDTPEVDHVTDLGMRALAEMRVTNLEIHLGRSYIARYEQVNGQAPPNDGFWGPPAFDSPHGPSRGFYLQAALDASWARRPERVGQVHGAGVAEVPKEVMYAVWDLGMLVLKGPLLVPPDIRDEAVVVAPILALARQSDHALLADAVYGELMARQAADPASFTGWSWIGAARIISDYLSPVLTGSATHTALVDAGVAQLKAAGWIDVGFPRKAFTSFERSRL